MLIHICVHMRMYARMLIYAHIHIRRRAGGRIYTCAHKAVERFLERLWTRSVLTTNALRAELVLFRKLLFNLNVLKDAPDPVHSGSIKLSMFFYHPLSSDVDLSGCRCAEFCFENRRVAEMDCRRGGFRPSTDVATQIGACMNVCNMCAPACACVHTCFDCVRRAKPIDPLPMLIDACATRPFVYATRSHWVDQNQTHRATQNRAKRVAKMSSN